jgi:hypothetical protein
MIDRPPYAPKPTFEQLRADSERLKAESARIVQQSKAIIELLNKPRLGQIPRPSGRKSKGFIPPPPAPFA